MNALVSLFGMAQVFSLLARVFLFVSAGAHLVRHPRRPSPRRLALARRRGWWAVGCGALSSALFHLVEALPA